MNFAALCGSLNGDCVASIKNMIKYICWKKYINISVESSVTAFLYIWCKVPKG
jgi:hypothetical protein